jgi:hypothetical protein
MLFEILTALFVSTVSATALPSPAIGDPQNNIFASHNASFCWKRTHGRGFGKLPDYRNRGTCANTLEKSWGLCYPSCGEFGQGRGPVCWGKCSEGSAFPHPCGGGCAKDAQACALNTIIQVKETVEVAYNFGAVISVAAAAAGKQNPLLNAGARLVAWTYIGEEVAEKTQPIFKKAIKHILSKYFDQREAEELTKQLAAAVYRDEIVTWTDFDPTSVTALVQAFYRPMCK